MAKVFISYSHDSDAHRTRVLDLSDRLIGDGVDCSIDQYLNGSPEQGWPLWMEQQLDEADYVLVVCTETYLNRVQRKERPGTGKGVKWESMLTYQDIYDNDSLNSKFIPVIFSAVDAAYVPKPLKAGTHYDLSQVRGYEMLYRYLTGQPLAVKPSPGSSVHLPPENIGQGEINEFDAIKHSLQYPLLILISVLVCTGIGAWLLTENRADTAITQKIGKAGIGGVLGDRIEQDVAEGGTGVVHTGTGDVQIGITFEQYEQGLKRRAAEVTQRLAKACGNRNQLLEAVQALEAYRKPQVDTIDEAVALLKEGKNQPAVEIFERIARSDGRTVKEVSEAYRHIGAITFLSDKERSIAAYLRSVELEPSNGDSWTSLGHLFLATRDYEKAKNAYSKAHEIAKTPENLELEAISLGNMGSLYLHQGLLQMAKQSIEQSLAIDQSTNRRCGMADSYNNLGLIKLGRARPNKAIKYFKQALAINLELKRKEEVEKNRRNIRTAKSRVANNEQAQRECDNYLSSISHPNEGNPNGLIFCAAEASRKKDDLSSANKIFHDSMAINIDENNMAAAIWDHIGLGKTNVDRTEYLTGLMYYQKALSVSKTHGSKLQLAHSYFGIGDASMLACRIQAAVSAFESALKIFNEINKSDLAEETRRLLNFLKTSTLLVQKGLLDSISFDNQVKCPFDHVR